jgi:hypothetical protein
MAEKRRTDTFEALVRQEFDARMKESPRSYVTAKEIAAEVGCSCGTARRHLANFRDTISRNGLGFALRNPYFDKGETDWNE